MAFVNEFVRKQKKLRIQPSQVICNYAVEKFSDGGRIIQLDTLGSSTREMTGNVSQTIQLDESRARALWKILVAEFGFN